MYRKKIFVIAPGMTFDSSKLAAGIDSLRSWGYEIEVPKSLKGKDLLCSSSKEKRCAHIKQALLSDADIIWCVRGGYGSIHLLPDLKKISSHKKAKVLIGFSDITMLHMHWQKHLNQVSLHGPHLDRWAFLNASVQKKTHKLLQGETVNLTGIKALNERAKSLASIRAKVVGGNLSCIQALMATDWQIECRGNLLFLEDIGERGYSVDRMLHQLEIAGIFRSVKGVLLGSFTAGLEPGGRPSKTQSVLKNFFKDYKKPVFHNLSVGHIEKNHPLVLNSVVKIFRKSTNGRYELEMRL